MPFKFFCKESGSYLCHICVLDKGQGMQPEWIDLEKYCFNISNQYTKKVVSLEHMQKNVQNMKTHIKNGKHIDKFFETLIQQLIDTHNHIKEEFRTTTDHNINHYWNQFEDKMVSRHFNKFA